MIEDKSCAADDLPSIPVCYCYAALYVMPCCAVCYLDDVCYALLCCADAVCYAVLMMYAMVR